MPGWKGLEDQLEGHDDDGPWLPAPWFELGCVIVFVLSAFGLTALAAWFMA